MQNMGMSHTNRIQNFVWDLTGNVAKKNIITRTKNNRGGRTGKFAFWPIFFLKKNNGKCNESIWPFKQTPTRWASEIIKRGNRPRKT